MIVDTSAIVAAIANEPDSERFRAAMLGAASLAMSSITALECRIVLYCRYEKEVIDAFDEMLGIGGISVVPFDRVLAAVAFDPSRKYGKDQGHPAQLNIIDCTSYALAEAWHQPLLLEGDHCSLTDVIVAT